MPKSATVLNLFLASPSDVPEERQAVERVIDRLNLGESFGEGISLNLIRWENCYPGASEEGVQDVINEQIKKSGIDIFLSVMHRKLGTPTRRAASGTVEELANAYELWHSAKIPHLCVYFKDASVPPTVEPDEVTPFRRRLESTGTVLYKRFALLSDFEGALYSDLPRVAREVLRARPSITRSNWIFGEHGDEMLLLCGGLVLSDLAVEGIQRDESLTPQKRDDVVRFPLGKRASVTYPDSPSLRFSATDVIGSSEIRALAHLCTAFAKPLAPRRVKAMTDIDADSRTSCDVIGLGAYSNSRSLEIIRDKANDLITPALFLVNGEWDARFISKETGLPVHEKLAAKRDFGLILKIRPELNPDRVWLFCGGLGEWGTSGAAAYLAWQWERITRELKADHDNFAALISTQEGTDERLRLEWVKSSKTSLPEFTLPNFSRVIRLDQDNSSTTPVPGSSSNASGF